MQSTKRRGIRVPISDDHAVAMVCPKLVLRTEAELATRRDMCMPPTQRAATTRTNTNGISELSVWKIFSTDRAVVSGNDVSDISETNFISVVNRSFAKQNYYLVILHPYETFARQ